MINERVKVGVGVFVVREVNGRKFVLLGKRKGAHGAGEFSLPGGKPDPGESPLDAAARELTEETGLHALGLRPTGHWGYDRFETDDLHYVTLYFICSDDSTRRPILKEPDKCEGWEWHRLDALPHPLFCGTSEAAAHLLSTS